MNDFFSFAEPWHLFFAIGVVLLAMEMLTNTFDLMWLGLGAMAGALTAWLVPDNTWLPMLVAGVVAIALTFAGKRWLGRDRDSRGFTDPIDKLINQHGKVLEPIAPQHMGIVRVGTETWSAVSDEAIPPGETVVIVKRTSTVLEVKRAG